MTDSRDPADGRQKSQRPSLWLDDIAAGILLLVMLALGWMILAASNAAWLRLASLELEFVLILALLVAALVLVSAIALRDTRR